MHPLRCDVGVQAPLFMKLPAEFQNLLLAGIELGLESVPLPLTLYPIPLQVSERGGHVRIKDSVWDISLHNRLFDDRENIGVRHHNTMPTGSYPIKVRL